MTQIEAIENNSQQLDETVKNIIGDRLQTLDEYIDGVKTCFMAQNEILDQDLNRIIGQLPVYLYDLIEFAQQIEMRAGVSDEQAKYAKNDALLQATGTVNEKTARAENATIEHRLTQLAYKTANVYVRKKIDGAIAIWESAKKIRQSRDKEISLTKMVGSSASAF